MTTPVPAALSAPNSLFFQVVEPPPLANVGWEVRVLDANDFTTVVAVVPDFITLSVGPQLSAAGAGSITVDLDSPFWNTTLADRRPARTLLDFEYLWEAWEDGALRFQWLGRNVVEEILDDSETQVVTISGPGAAEILRFAVTLPPGYPVVPTVISLETAVSSSNDVPALGWEFPPTWPAMRMWYALFEAALSRRTIRWVKPLFTATEDSGGEEWDYVPTVATAAGQGFRPTPGQDLLDFLNDATGQQTSKHFAAYAEWVMWPGGYLDVRTTIGTHREKDVIFFDGRLRSKHRTRSRDEIANYVVATDIYGGSSLAVDVTSQSQWNQRERLENKNQNVTDAGRRDAIAQLVLKQGSAEKSQWTVQVPYDEPGRRPFIDYDLGDWIGVSQSHPSGPSTVEAFRVKAILVSVRTDQTLVELTLQSVFDLRQLSLEAQLTQLLNQVGNSSLSTLPDVNIPITPKPNDYLGWDGTQWTNLSSGDDLSATIGGGAHSTTSTTYTELALPESSPGPSVAVTTDTSVIVILTCTLFNNPGNHSFMSFEVGGASTIAPSDSWALFAAVTTGAPIRMSAVHRVSGLTPGPNTFTAKYRAGGGTAYFQDRHLIVLA